MADGRSSLFFDLLQKVNEVEVVCRELGLWVLSFVENVVPDDSTVQIMSKALDVHPVFCCSSCIRRVRRPRLSWCRARLSTCMAVDVDEGTLYDKVVFDADIEPLDLWVTGSWVELAGGRAGRGSPVAYLHAVHSAKGAPTLSRGYT